MAAIFFKNSNPITDVEAVRNFLTSKGLEYRYWETPSLVAALLQKESLTDEEKEELLRSLDHRFQELKDEYGYSTRDLIVLHPQVPGLSEMLAKFDKMHYHTDDEVRYIVDGSGIFGFSVSGEEFTVHVEKNDFISVPKHTHHWFKLDERMRIKAVRYFIDTSGWVPHYVE